MSTPRSPSAAPIVLEEGEAPVATFTVHAAANYTRYYALDGVERLSWKCHVLDDYDIVSSSSITCAGLQSGLDRRSEVTERERAEAFDGYVDLKLDHAGAIRGIGAMGNCLSGTSAMLALEFDNSYSYFTPKRIELHMFKVGLPLAATTPVAKDRAPVPGKLLQDSIADCKSSRHWERALQLLRQSRSEAAASSSAPDGMPAASESNTAACHTAALEVFAASGQWERAMRLLDEMREAGPAPDAQDYATILNACEKAGAAEQALRLMDAMDECTPLSGGGKGSHSDAAGGEVAPNGDGDLDQLAWAISEGLAHCPADAADIRSHLLEAQRHFENYVHKRTRQLKVSDGTVR